MNQAIPIAEGLFTSLDPTVTQLIGSRCTECGSHSFPRMDSCPRCCSRSVEPVELSRTGTLWTWTRQSFMPPSPPYRGPETSHETFQPFLMGMVELPGQCRVIGRLQLADEDRIEIGMKLELTLFPYTSDKDGNTLMNYAFTNVE